MVYRESARRSREVEAPSEVLLRVDVSGRAGADGVDGADGSSGAWSGQSGSHGGHAGSASPGEDGGAIVVTLTEPHAGTVRLSGQRFAPDGSRTPIDESREIGDHGFIDLVAMGGAGGHGGDGGDGGHGATGSRGADATRYSSGSNGGPGGDGGNGGSATSGADGGAGGSVLVRVHERDTHLLMLVRRNVGGGDGGRPGRNGRGGTGGSGGAGGSSYSWSTTTSYRDSQGNTRHRTKWHRNPGGSRGPSGYDGASGMARVQPGSDGSDGRFAIEVEDDGGRITTYPERYDIRLVSFDHVSDNADGIYEPGERVRVRELKVRNVGGMPTPKHRRVLLHLRSDALVHPEDEHLELPPGLPAAHEITLTSRELRFRIGEYRPTGPADALSLSQTVRHGAYLPAVERPFTRYETEGSVALGRFRISFPVELSPIECLRSLAGGQASAFRFCVRSRSQRMFGVDGDLGRALRVKLFFRESELGDAAVWARDPEGRPLSLAAGHVREIARIRPEEELSFEYVLGVEADAEEYAAARVWVALELGHVDRPLEARPIQYRAHETRVARRYRHREGAEVLLVVNHRTSSATLRAWERAAEGLGFSLDVLDVSYEGRLDPAGEREDGPPLLTRLDRGTVLILNDVVETPAGATPASTFVDPERLRQATARGLDVAFVGEPVGLSAFLPSPAGAPDAIYEEESELIAAIEASAGRVDVELVLHRIGLWFEEPSELLVSERARALSERLAAIFPARRFVIVHRHEVERTHEGYVLRRWRAGSLRVLSLGEPGTGRVLEAAVPEERRRSPEYPASPENLTTMLLARGFDERIDHLIGVARREGVDPASARSLVDAMLVDLAAEHQSVLVTGFRAGLDAERLLAALPLLRTFVSRAEDATPGVDPDSPLGAELCRLLGRLRFLTASQVRLWEWPLFFLRRSVPLRGAMLELLDRLATALFADGSDPERDRVLLDEAEERIDDVVRELKERHRSDRGRISAQLLLEPIAWQWLTADVERRAAADQRVLSWTEHARLARERAERAETREALESACAEARRDLLRTGAGPRVRVAAPREAHVTVEAESREEAST